MSYFEPADPHDLSLLHADVRTHDELANVAAQAEEDVIDHFRRQEQSSLPSPSSTNQGVYEVFENGLWYTTYLWGFKPDPADAEGFNTTRSAWTGFAKAFRQTVANVISHRLLHYDTDETLTSVGRGRRSESRQHINKRWPPNWTLPLARYDRVPRIFAV